MRPLPAPNLKPLSIYFAVTCGADQLLGNNNALPRMQKTHPRWCTVISTELNDLLHTHFLFSSDRDQVVTVFYFVDIDAFYTCIVHRVSYDHHYRCVVTSLLDSFQISCS